MPFENDFKNLTGFAPLSWQKRLFDEYFARSKLPSSVDIPPSLGKTAVMALWLIARAQSKSLPRRLVYVVDRRAIVDQATDFALKLRENLDGAANSLKVSLGLDGRPLPISTLRGQHIDNREWLDDPSIPAIIVGTVDMIGSRLLFEGYGVSRKMRPYHAGLLGVDTLVVLDEAHLVPPFEKLIESVAERSGKLGPRDQGDDEPIPPFKLLSLSATGRKRADSVFRLEDSDLEEPHLKDPITKQRLDAKKRLTFCHLEDEKLLPTKLAKTAWDLSADCQSPVRCILFCNSRETAERTEAAIENLAKKTKGQAGTEVDTELFVGARRMREREKAREWLQEMGFIAKDKEQEKKKFFLIATSAGEVGVDLDADHMVCDLVAWERMVQRLGRVNRRGEGDARILVVDPGPPKPKKTNKPTPEEEKKSQRHFALCRLFVELSNDDGSINASPGALRSLKLRAEQDPELQALITAATTPEPLRPALTRPLVDAWSMTSLKEHTGRPEVAPWLRGWVDDEPQTGVVWRRCLPVRANGVSVRKQEIEDFFEAAPPHVSEVLETETHHVVGWLLARANAILGKKPSTEDPSDQISDANAADDPSPVAGESLLRGTDTLAYALSPAGDLRQKWTLNELRVTDKKLKQSIKNDLQRQLSGATLIVDSRIGGLNDDGMLDKKKQNRPRTADDGGDWLEVETASDEAPSASTPPVIRFKVRTAHSDDEQGEGTLTDAQTAGEDVRTAHSGYKQAEGDTPWRERFRFATEQTDEKTVWLIVDKWRHDAANEEDRSISPVSREQILQEHQKWVACKARELAERIGLPEPYSEALKIAAHLHDRGKEAERWQRAFNVRPGDGPYAKTRGPVNVSLLDGYRHEFGSLSHVENDPDFRSLSPDLQDLVLHLVSAHHGQARPVISTAGCDDAPPSRLEQQAREVALRFARLQKRWGPWGLAWWESLLRAADQQASRDNDEGKSPANCKETD